MENIYTHFREEERDFIDKVLDWQEQVGRQHSPRLTDFLDPREQYIMSSLIGTTGEVQVALFGGNERTERKRAFLYPDYLPVADEDFELAVIEVEYNEKFHSITHPQVLGSLMGIGLKRQKYGDIIIDRNRVQIVVARDFYPFVHMHLQHIGKVPVKLKQMELEDLLEPVEDWQESHGTIASFRLDAVLGEIFNISRQISQRLIQSGSVKVNHKTIEKAAYDCTEGDLFSVRGYGRGKIMNIHGKTKKENWRFTYGVKKRK